MADGQDEGLDVVQHPQLGTLKFPKSMPIAERNDSIQTLELKTGAGMMTPKAPAPQLPASADTDAEIRDKVGASGMFIGHSVPGQEREERANRITGGTMIGGAVAPLLAPAAGLLGSSALIGAGTGVGTSAGQLASGENPLEPENLKESGENALIGGGTSLGIGALGKAIGFAGRPGLLRSVTRDAASKYAGRSLAEAILPEPPPRIALPEGSSATNVVRPGPPMSAPAGSGAVTTSGTDVRFGAPPPEVSLPEGSSTTSMARTGPPMSPPSGSGAMTTTGPAVHFGEIPQPEPELGSPENPGWLAKLPNTMPKLPKPLLPEPELGSQENPGWLVKLPNRMPAKIGAPQPEKIGASLALRETPSGSPDDLISRTRAIVRPGEQPSPVDLKRAGDLTQAPLGRLRTLAQWGDELAKNEINRRLQNP